MRNLRKTRKRGGLQFVPGVYSCAPGTDVEDCAQEFAASQGFQIIDTADNGNCFYDSLAKYGARTGNPATSKSHLALRREVVQYMLNNQALYEAYLLDDVPSPPDPPAGPVTAKAAAAAAKAKVAHQQAITARLRGYLQPYTWAGGLGDVFPQVAAQILNLNITIYDVEANGNINMIAMGPGAGGVPSPGVPVVNLIRTNGNHFRLLWPGGPARAPTPPRAPSRRAPPPRAPSPLKPANNAARRTVRRRKPQVAPVVEATNAVYAMNKLAANVAAVNIGNKGRAPSPPPRRLTARQKSMMAVAAAKAAPVPNAKPKRQSRGKKKKENNNYEGRQLQEALVANIESRKAQRRNSKNSANSNNELAKAIQMSLFNV